MRYYDSERHRRRWAQNLYTARLDRQLTQAELGRLLGIDQQNISRWERGRSAPRDDMKILLAKFFQVPVTALFPWLDDEDNGANGDEGQAA